jgi:hypothetical protein
MDPVSPIMCCARYATPEGLAILGGGLNVFAKELHTKIQYHCAKATEEFLGDEVFTSIPALLFFAAIPESELEHLAQCFVKWGGWASCKVPSPSGRPAFDPVLESVARQQKASTLRSNECIKLTPVIGDDLPELPSDDYIRTLTSYHLVIMRKCFERPAI